MAEEFLNFRSLCQRSDNVWFPVQASTIDLAKKEAAILAIASATNDVQRKKAVEAQTMLMRYGTSRFLQLLDDEPAPSSENRILMARDERIAGAEH